MSIKCCKTGHSGENTCPLRTKCSEECYFTLKLAAPPAVGDVNSAAKGSGARFNAGKVPVEMIPVWITAVRTAQKLFVTKAETEMQECLYRLGEWQRGNRRVGWVLQAIPHHAMAEAARVFKTVTERPVNPYPLWNWLKGMPWSVPTACAVRHALAYLVDGQENDPETKLSHWGHFACNIIMLAQYESTYLAGDDRPLQYLCETDPFVATGAKDPEPKGGYRSTWGSPTPQPMKYQWFHASRCATNYGNDACDCGRGFGPDHAGGPR